MLVSASVHEHMHAVEFRKGVDLRLNGVSSTLKFRIQIKVMSSLLVLAANHLQTIQYVVDELSCDLPGATYAMQP